SSNQLFVHTSPGRSILQRSPLLPENNELFIANCDCIPLIDNVIEEWGLSHLGFSNGASYADMDNDGDLDLVVGNWGENNKFHPTVEKPLHVFVGHMDDNKTWDIVLAKEKANGLLPVRGRECSSEQVPLILDKFPSYEAFAIANLNEIYSDERLNEALHSYAETMTSGVYLNEGEEFRFVAFPKEAQISPIKDMELVDLNKDGNMDIVFTGNHFPAEVETVRYDAGIGGVLTGNGDGTMTWMPLSQSGFYTPEDTRSLIRVPLKKGREYWLVGVNSGLVKVLERRVN
ncbi:MAG: hypothetical protein HRT74_07525, partial [Flavobacteriales bacterium]|nr:hypothetical protein [Flavobacteriales bacterium]